jgi:hypothetical protein
MFFVTVKRVFLDEHGKAITKDEEIRGDQVQKSRTWNKGHKDSTIDGPMAEVTMSANGVSSYCIRIAEDSKLFIKRVETASGGNS